MTGPTKIFGKSHTEVFMLKCELITATSLDTSYNSIKIGCQNVMRVQQLVKQRTCIADGFIIDSQSQIKPFQLSWQKAKCWINEIETCAGDLCLSLHSTRSNLN